MADLDQSPTFDTIVEWMTHEGTVNKPLIIARADQLLAHNNSLTNASGQLNGKMDDLAATWQGKSVITVAEDFRFNLSQLPAITQNVSSAEQALRALGPAIDRVNQQLQTLSDNRQPTVGEDGSAYDGLSEDDARLGAWNLVGTLMQQYDAVSALLATVGNTTWPGKQSAAAADPAGGPGATAPGGGGSGGKSAGGGAAAKSPGGSAASPAGGQGGASGSGATDPNAAGGSSSGASDPSSSSQSPDGPSQSPDGPGLAGDPTPPAQLPTGGNNPPVTTPITTPSPPPTNSLPTPPYIPPPINISQPKVDQPKLTEPTFNEPNVNLPQPKLAGLGSGINGPNTTPPPGSVRTQSNLPGPSEPISGANAGGSGGSGAAPQLAGQAAAEEAASQAGARGGMPYMPPMSGMPGAGGKNGGQIRPGTAENAGGPALGQRPSGKAEYVGVPDELRGRSADKSIGPARRRRPKKSAAARTEATGEVLDEHLWQVDRPASS